MGTAKSLYISRNGRSYLRIRRAAWGLVLTFLPPPPPLYVSIPHMQAARSRNPYGLLAQVTLHKSCSHWSSVLKLLTQKGSCCQLVQRESRYPENCHSRLSWPVTAVPLPFTPAVSAQKKSDFPQQQISTKY